MEIPRIKNTGFSLSELWCNKNSEMEKVKPSFISKFNTVSKLLEKGVSSWRISNFKLSEQLFFLPHHPLDTGCDPRLISKFQGVFVDLFLGAVFIHKLANTC